MTARAGGRGRGREGRGRERGKEGRGEGGEGGKVRQQLSSLGTSLT